MHLVTLWKPTELVVAGNRVARKETPRPSLRTDYKDAFEPD
jgi:hypothetical protein